MFSLLCNTILTFFFLMYFGFAGVNCSVFYLLNFHLPQTNLWQVYEPSLHVFKHTRWSRISFLLLSHSLSVLKPFIFLLQFGLLSRPASLLSPWTCFSITLELPLSPTRFGFPVFWIPCLPTCWLFSYFGGTHLLITSWKRMHNREILWNFARLKISLFPSYTWLVI